MKTIESSFDTDIKTINADIARHESAIAADRKLADQLAAMQAAAKRATEAEVSIAQLRSRLAEAEARKRSQEATLARYSVVSIKANAGEVPPGPMSAHTVTFAERNAGLYGPEITHVTHPLHGLPPELRAVVLAEPKKIPDYIRALGADVSEALQQHALSMNRGYLVTKATQGHYVPTSHVPGVTFV